MLDYRDTVGFLVFAVGIGTGVIVMIPFLLLVTVGAWWLGWSHWTPGTTVEEQQREARERRASEYWQAVNGR